MSSLTAGSLRDPLDPLARVGLTIVKIKSGRHGGIDRFGSTSAELTTPANQNNWWFDLYRAIPFRVGHGLGRKVH